MQIWPLNVRAVLGIALPSSNDVRSGTSLNMRLTPWGLLYGIRSLKFPRLPTSFLFPCRLKELASWFQMLCLRFSGRAWREVEVNGQFDTEFERVKRSCADLASQMWCPRHFKNATVEIDGDRFDDFGIEVITCCEEFRKRVEDALDELVTHRV